MTHLCVLRQRKNPSSFKDWRRINCDSDPNSLNTERTPCLASNAGTRDEGCSDIKEISIWRTSCKFSSCGFQVSFINRDPTVLTRRYFQVIQSSSHLKYEELAVPVLHPFQLLLKKAKPTWNELHQHNIFPQFIVFPHPLTSLTVVRKLRILWSSSSFTPLPISISCLRKSRT